jgi:hypothetical protein
MNAYELAKELEDFSYSYELDIALLPVINMLRQQQAEIEELKALLVEEQDESFDRTASHMAGEYVAYQKELTDEEIAGVVARGWCSEKNSMKTMDSDLAWAIVEELKAILRKAKE